MQHVARSDWDWLSRFEQRHEDEEERRWEERFRRPFLRMAEARPSPRRTRPWMRQTVGFIAVSVLTAGLMAPAAWSALAPGMSEGLPEAARSVSEPETSPQGL